MGQKGGHTYLWAPVGSRPLMVRDNRHVSTYIFGAICPDRAVGAVLRALYKNEASFALRVDALGHVTAVCAGAHAAEHVADVHHADVGGFLGDGTWRGRPCSATTIAVHADRFIFVVIG